MPLIICPDCGKEISDQAPACLNCGRPGPFTATPEASAPITTVTPTNTAGHRSGSYGSILLFLAACVILGDIAYLKFVRPHPLIAQCEDVIRANLKSPSSYKPVKRYFSASNGPAYVVIEYEAANPFNAILSDRCVCVLGPTFVVDGDTAFSEKSRLLGMSPFETMRITSVLDEDGKEGYIPVSAEYKKTLLTQAAPPAFIIGWRGSGPYSYILSDKPPTEEELAIARKNMQPAPPVVYEPTWDDLFQEYAILIGKSKACGENVDKYIKDAENKIRKKFPDEADYYLDILRSQIEFGESEALPIIYLGKFSIDGQDNKEQNVPICKDYTEELASAKMPE